MRLLAFLRFTPLSNLSAFDRVQRRSGQVAATVQRRLARGIQAFRVLNGNRHAVFRSTATLRRASVMYASASRLSLP